MPHWRFATFRVEVAKKYWSGRVTKESNALDLESDVFNQRSARKIAESLKRSAEHSRRRKAGPFGSAMSMLSFYINRAGKNLPDSRVRTLERAKDELRKLYGRPVSKRHRLKGSARSKKRTK
ncbi:MAG: DUF3175 domain-containing protein [Candidatus Eremiobacteraeota bacterium]|nr:DUF3175 domain-containing protein [Candidatus Eremiobacteraeota bacterium]